MVLYVVELSIFKLVYKTYTFSDPPLPLKKCAYDKWIRECIVKYYDIITAWEKSHIL